MPDCAIGRLALTCAFLLFLSPALGGGSALSKGIEDLFAHFWIGTKAEGHILPTWHGLAVKSQADKRGSLWEAGTFLNVLYTQFRLNLGAANRQPIVAEWNYIRSAFKVTDFSECGSQSSQNFASDDTGAIAAALLQLYDVTRDQRALIDAERAVRCGYRRWSDSQLGGGLWYDDSRNIKSLYQTMLADDAMRIYELTKERSYLYFALQSYKWMQRYLLRADNLYWADYGWRTNDHSTAPAPLGASRPRDIALANSVSYLAGNMAMDVLDVRWYCLTGDETYLQRAVATARAMLATYDDDNGGFLDDRDGWTNGDFVREWIIETYPLLPGELQRRAFTMFATTARAILKNDRTPTGYYGAAWNGPLKSAWTQAVTVPEQIMTSATAVALLAAPALIAAKLPPPIIRAYPGVLK